MKIKRDPKAEAIEEIAEVLRNHEWLFHTQMYDGRQCGIHNHLLADLVYDLIQKRRGEVVN